MDERLEHKGCPSLKKNISYPFFLFREHDNLGMFGKYDIYECYECGYKIHVKCQVKAPRIWTDKSNWTVA